MKKDRNDKRSKRTHLGRDHGPKARQEASQKAGPSQRAQRGHEWAGMGKAYFRVGMCFLLFRTQTTDFIFVGKTFGGLLPFEKA